ncbi:MAG: ABC transporter ATP-binding protein [Sphingomicrobium sp.]
MIFRQLLGYARPYRAQLALLAGLSAASSVVLLTVPWLAGQLIGGVVSGNDLDPRRLLALLVGALAGLALVNYALACQEAIVGARVLADLRGRVHDHVQRLPLSFHHGREKGDTLALLTVEVARLGHFLTATLVGLPARVLMTIGSIVLLFRIDSQLALIVPLMVPGFYLILKIVGRRQRALALALQQSEAKVVSLAEETLEMVPATKAFTREGAGSTRYRAAVEEVFRRSVRLGRVAAALEPLIALLASLAAVAILLAAGQSLHSGAMTPAQLFSFVFYAALLTRPVGALADVYGQVQTARGTLARLQSVLGQPAEEIGVSDRGETLPPAGEIQFSEVCFGYPGRPLTLDGVSFTIRPGETVALTGPNGAGKTAILNLLLRFYEPHSGAITIDGTNIADVGLGQLRRGIGLVPQTTLLLNGTIRDNIAFGADKPTPQAIENAARLAQAHNFIAALPEGMDTVIGDRGIRLSGGQRQRIALARALIKDPPIMLFDEATSMFDEEGEAAFIAECASSLSNRTVIIITHRSPTLALADRVFRLDPGSLTEIEAGREGLSAIQA